MAIASYVGVWYVKLKLRGEALTPTLSMVAQTILHSTGLNPSMKDAAMKRLWSVFHALVEFEHGNQMDELREKEGIVLLAKTCADFEIEPRENSAETLKSRLERGITKNTAPYDTFVNAYSARMIEIGLAQKQ